MDKNDEILDLPATKLTALIRKKELSPVALIEASITRIQALNPVLNAVVTDNFEAARNEAKAAEKAVLEGQELGLLHGLPVGVKDLEITKGLRTSFGSKLFADNIPAHDQSSVAALRREGAIIIGKTNTPEFGAGGNTRNLLFGATSNPFDISKTSGGSSGGAAAGLATGMMALATGSDYGGSVRTPSGFCGVAGFRPSPGTIPAEDKPVSLSPFSVLGPMARNIGDIDLLLRAQLGADRRDPFSVAVDYDLELPLEAADLSSVTLLLSDDLDGAPLCAEYRQLFAEKTQALRNQAFDARDGHPDFDGADNAFEVLRGVNFIAAHGQKVQQHKDKLGPFVIDNVERGLAYTAADIALAHSQQSKIAKSWLAMFEGVDAVIAPACSVPPFAHENWTVKEIDGIAMPTYMSWLALTYRPTMALACAAAIPCGLDKNGLPFGLQVLGPPGSDRKILNIALAIEQLFASTSQTKRPCPDIASLQETGA